MKKLIAMALSLVMVLLMMAGCGILEQAKLVGTWKAEVDLSEAISQEILGEVGDMGEYFKIDSFKVNFVMTLNSDSTYSVTLEEASVEAAFDELLLVLKDGMIKMLKDQIAEMGLEMTVEEMLAASGMSIDSLMEELAQSLEDEDIVESLVEECSNEGNYKVNDGKLYMSDGLEYGVDENVYDTYVLDGDKLTLVEYVGGDEEDMAITKMVYPMVFTKVG